MFHITLRMQNEWRECLQNTEREREKEEIRGKDLITRIKTGRATLQVPDPANHHAYLICVYIYITLATVPWGRIRVGYEVCVFSGVCVCVCSQQGVCNVFFFFPADTVVILSELFVQSPQGLSGAYLC